MRVAERQRAIGLALDGVALFVHGPVMPATEQGQICQRRRASTRPVVNVMPLRDPDAAAGEATAAVAMLERPAERRRNRSRARADLDESAVGVRTHHDTACIARQALGRFL
jgi:hypothetical protein